MTDKSITNYIIFVILLIAIGQFATAFESMKDRQRINQLEQKIEQLEKK